MTRKTKMKDPSKRYLQRLVILFLLGVIAVNLGVCFYYTLNSGFDADEFQHAHIAWHVRNGKIIYRDFFEHHGPLFSLLNGLLFRFFVLEPGVQALFFFRYASFFYLSLMLLATFLVGRRLSGSFFVGLVSSALLSGLVFFQDKATEIRPDVLQNFFVLLGAFFVLKFLEEEKMYFIFLAGFFFGAAVMSNAKAVVAPSAVFVFFVVDYVLLERRPKNLPRKLCVFSFGFLSIFALFILYFASANALNEFFFYNFNFNFTALFKSQARSINSYVVFFLRDQLVYVLSLFPGFMAVFHRLVAGGLKTGGDKPKLVLFMTMTLILSTTLFLGLYKQQFLLFLPFLSVTSAFGLHQLGIWSRRRSAHIKVVYALVFVFVFISLVDSGKQLTRLAGKDVLEKQVKLTSYILKKTERDEPVLFTWNYCGGYVFNEDVQYYWMTSEGYYLLFSEKEGFDLFGSRLTRLMDEKNVGYIISSKEYFKSYPPEAYNYINRNYNTLMEGCLLERKQNE